MELKENVKFSAFEALFSKNVPHLLEKIFFCLDYESYKRCIEVSNVWHNLLTSDSFKKKGKSVFHTEILKDGSNLFDAAKEGDEDMVKKPLSTGMIDVNIAVTQESLGALFGAAYNGHRDAVQLLLQHGAKPKMRDQHGATPLHWAAYLGHKAVVKQLIDGGADHNRTNIWGKTPLHQAVEGGKKDVVKLLVDAGADQNIADEEGKTPLMLALERDELNIVKVLTGEDILTLLKRDSMTAWRQKRRMTKLLLSLAEEHPVSSVVFVCFVCVVVFGITLLCIFFSNDPRVGCNHEIHWSYTTWDYTKPGTACTTGENWGSGDIVSNRDTGQWDVRRRGGREGRKARRKKKQKERRRKKQKARKRKKSKSAEEMLAFGNVAFRSPYLELNHQN